MPVPSVRFCTQFRPQDQFFRLSTAQRDAMVTFVVARKATLCGESISPEHQHIQSYRDDQGMIQVGKATGKAGFFLLDGDK